MTRNWLKSTIVVTVLAGLVTFEAAAWGPQTKRAIAATAIEVIRRSYPEAFKTREVNFEEDVFAGMTAGACEALNKNKPFANEGDALAAVDNEIKLLREMRQYGVGSFFCYHMGALGALVADLMMPLSPEASPNEVDIRKKMEADIDTHLRGYHVTIAHKDRETILRARDYFEQTRPFIEDNRRMIADDYRRGDGYEGFLKEGGEAIFSRATEAVADVWNTVFQARQGVEAAPPPRSVLTWYMVDQIGYLLNQKKNIQQATAAYDTFEKVNPSIPAAYEKVGDLFYAFGTDEGRDRGVREWRVAYNAAGPNRREVGKKLANHYIKVGEALLAKGVKPGATNEDLPNAMNAFTQALAFDESNNLAAARLNEANTAIAERRERRQLNVNMIASAEKVMVQAKKSREASDFSNAIATYNQAIGLFQAVDTNFTDQATTARESIKEINKDIAQVVNSILDSASDAIDKGDKAADTHDYEGAVKDYERVAAIVGTIPGDLNAKDRQDLIDSATKKISDSKAAKQKWEAKKQADEEAAKRLAATGGK